MRNLRLFIAILLVSLLMFAAPVMAATEGTPAGIDWSPVTTALIGLIVAIITTFIPMGVKLFFEMQSAKLAKLKALTESNQDIADSAVLFVQQSMNTLTNDEKYIAAVQRLSLKLSLPPDALRELIETSVGAFKLEWGNQWKALGGKTNSSATP